MLKLRSNSHNILATIKSNNTFNESDSTDLIIICKDGKIVQNYKQLFCIYSPTLRNILGTISNIDTSVVFLPDFRKLTVEKLVNVMELAWTEFVLFDKETLYLLQCLDIAIGDSLHVNDVTDIVTTDDEKSEEENEIETDMYEDASNTNQNYQDSPDSLKQLFSKKKVFQANCPYCSKQFLGTTIYRLKDMLKCHIGYIHFREEIMSEVKIYFDKDLECKDCNKTFKRLEAQKKHLFFNHTIYVEKIMSIVNKALKQESETKDFGHEDVVTIIENAEKPVSLTSLKIATSLRNEFLKKGEIIKVDETLNGIDDSFLIGKVAPISVIIEQNYSDLEASKENSAIFSEVSTKSELSTYLRCSFECDQTWKKSNITKTYTIQLIKFHLMNHFKQQFSEHHQTYFTGDQCIVCHKTGGFSVPGHKNKHLFGKHDIMREVIETAIENILKGSTAVSNVDKQIHTDVPCDNLDDEIESLLHSDEEEEMDETADIQELLLADVSDDEDDEDDEANLGDHDNVTEKEDIDETADIQDLLLANVSDDKDDETNLGDHDNVTDQEETEWEIQKNLLQDMSDDDTDDEDVDNKDDFKDDENHTNASSIEDETIPQEDDQDDADSIQRNLLLYQDISDDDEDE